jgi:cysteine desulfurase family protein (TIGR01976 family)
LELKFISKKESGAYPIEAVREQFPALSRIHNGKSVVYLDGPSGTQVVQGAIDAAIRYLTDGGANLGGMYPTSEETGSIVKLAREAVADFVGALPEEVIFGPNSTTLIFALSRILSRHWTVGDEVVVTELDHRANVDPWLTAAEGKGVNIQWIKLDPQKLVLNLDNLDQIINEKTKLVAVGHASNGVGTINDISIIAKRARKVGALVIVDAVHSAPHILIDREQLDADVVFFSAYKFFAPHVGMMIVRKSLLETLDPYKVISSPKYIPDNFETGTANFEGIAGITPAINFIAELGEGQNRREKIVDAFSKLHNYENELAGKVRSAFAEIPEIDLYQAPDDIAKTPTVAFRVVGKSPAEICRQLSDQFSIFVGNGHFYAETIGDLLDLNKSGGWIRAGIAPYTTEEEIDRFITAVKKSI